MQRLILLTGSLICFFALSCKSQVITPKDPQPTKDPTVYKGVTDQSCAMEMSFGSPGSGIDGAAYEKALKVLDEYKVKFTAKTIGREGETRLCMPLTELKGKRKAEFISRLKKIAKEGQLVSVSIR